MPFFCTPPFTVDHIPFPHNLRKFRTAPVTASINKFPDPALRFPYSPIDQRHNSERDRFLRGIRVTVAPIPDYNHRKICPVDLEAPLLLHLSPDIIFLAARPRRLRESSFISSPPYLLNNRKYFGFNGFDASALNETGGDLQLKIPFESPLENVCGHLNDFICDIETGGGYHRKPLGFRDLRVSERETAHSSGTEIPCDSRNSRDARAVIALPTSRASQRRTRSKFRAR